jgi:hypothetical protein
MSAMFRKRKKNHSTGICCDGPLRVDGPNPRESLMVMLQSTSQQPVPARMTTIVTRAVRAFLRSPEVVVRITRFRLLACIGLGASENLNRSAIADR